LFLVEKYVIYNHRQAKNTITIITTIVITKKYPKRNERKNAKRNEEDTNTPLVFCMCFINNHTYPSSNFMVVGILSATSNVCPNDADEDKIPVVTDEKC